MLVGGRDVERVLTRLLQRGREAGVHLICCTQKPTTAVIGSLVKSNFPVRLVGSVTSPEDAKVAAGIAATGAEKLLGRGDFLVVVKGQVLRLQAAHVSVGEIQTMVAKLQEGGRRSRRWLEEATGTEGKANASLKTRLVSQLRLIKVGSR
jgi:S-DNA-T family DNA segregation ATPase FtsK/SpoIIIE